MQYLARMIGGTSSHYMRAENQQMTNRASHLLVEFMHWHLIGSQRTDVRYFEL